MSEEKESEKSLESTIEQSEEPQKIQSLLDLVSEPEEDVNSRITFEEFTDERKPRDSTRLFLGVPSSSAAVRRCWGLLGPGLKEAKQVEERKIPD